MAATSPTPRARRAGSAARSAACSRSTASILATTPDLPGRRRPGCRVDVGPPPRTRVKSDRRRPWDRPAPAAPGRRRRGSAPIRSALVSKTRHLDPSAVWHGTCRTWRVMCRTSADLKQEILRYVRAHTESAETPEGIARWWLARQRFEDAIEAVLV